MYYYSINVLPTAESHNSLDHTKAAGPSAFATQKGENLFFVVAKANGEYRIWELCGGIFRSRYKQSSHSGNCPDLRYLRSRKLQIWHCREVGEAGRHRFRELRWFRDLSFRRQCDIRRDREDDGKRVCRLR